MEAFRKSSQISIIKGKEVVPNPILTFDEAGFPAEIMKTLQKTDFSAPMPWVYPDYLFLAFFGVF